MAGGSFAPFVNRGEQIRRYQVDVGHSELIIFKIFAGFYSRRPEPFRPNDQVHWRREVLWLPNFGIFKTPKFVNAADAFSFLSE